MDDQSLFAGDLIAGQGTVSIRPPDGDMDDYLASLRSLRSYGISKIMPGHWPPVDDPQGKITEYIDHRMEREREVIAAIRGGAQSTAQMADRIYPDIDARLRGAAMASISAHIISLERRGMVRVVHAPGGHSYELTSRDV
jgi:glyoxylase-like metal-dependent hydrolase (beta-lactamase superfamily II)